MHLVRGQLASTAPTAPPCSVDSEWTDGGLIIVALHGFCEPLLTLCLCCCSVAKPSTALWTRARHHRPACPPTTTPCSVSTTPGTTSPCGRLVRKHAPRSCLLTPVEDHAQRPVAAVQTRVWHDSDGITSSLGCLGLPASPPHDRVRGS